MPVVQLATLVSLKAGDAREPHRVRIAIVSPGGKSLLEPKPDAQVDFNEPEAGVNVILNVTLGLAEGGLYWLEVYLDDDPEPLTRTPVRVLKVTV